MSRNQAGGGSRARQQHSGGKPALGNGIRAGNMWHTCRQRTWPSGRLYRPSAWPDGGGPLSERGPATTGTTRARRARAAGAGLAAALKACKQAGPAPFGVLHSSYGMPAHTAEAHLAGKGRPQDGGADHAAADSRLGRPADSTRSAVLQRLRLAAHSPNQL